MTRILLPLLALLVAGVVHAESRSIERTLSPFDVLESELPTDVTWEPGAQSKLTAVGDADLIARLKIDNSGGKLRLSLSTGFSFHDEKLRITLTSPSLREARLSGSGDLEIRRATGASFRLDLSGSGDAVAKDLDVRRLEANLAGSGDLTASGKADSAALFLQGSGDIHAVGLKAREVDAKLAGSGDVHLNASERVGGRCAGSGDIHVYGNPARRDVRAAGACDVHYLP
jgi:hypothetical protein